MADIKSSAFTANAAPAGTDIFGTAQAGVDIATTLAQVKTFVNTAPVKAAGSASAGTWPKMTAGTVMTTAEAGATELDTTNFYDCSEAGNRALRVIRHYIRANATRTFASNTTQQAIFSSPANGALALAVGVYEFESLLGMDTMSATNGNGKWSLLGAGTATLGSILQFVYGTDIASNTTSSLGGSQTALATQTTTNAATAGVSTELIIRVVGTFEVTVTGTIIPSFAQTTAAAAVVKVGSFFHCHRVGASGRTSVGNWT